VGKGRGANVVGHRDAGREQNELARFAEAKEAVDERGTREEQKLGRKNRETI
jgi:hypothetical protein